MGRNEQSMFDLGEPRQNALEFPVSLALKYEPRVGNFVGLAEPQRIFGALLKNPRPCSILCIGAPGNGKTVMGMSFAEQLPAGFHHLKSQTCDVATLQQTWDKLQYMPAKGKFHVVLCDEANGMTDKAQLQWLSYGDGAAGLRPLWGGGFERGQAPPVIWIWTVNGIGPGQTRPPLTLESKFVSRQTYRLKFMAPDPKTLGQYLKAIWEKEKGPKGYPVEWFAKLAKGVGVRDALNRLDSELLAPRPLKEIREEVAAVAEVPDADEELRECYAFLIPSEQERAVHLEKRAKDGKASKAEMQQLRTYRSWNKRYQNDAEKRMTA